MESISPVENTCTSTRVPSRDDVLEEREDAISSSTSSRRNSLEVTSENIPLSRTTYSRVQGTPIIEQYETTISTMNIDATGKNLQPRSYFQVFREIMIKFWLWEATACIFSLFCLASIVGILIYADGKLLDQWQWSTIPPTALVSFIGTLGKASLVLVLSQVLSQLKWLHFRQTKSLQHIRTFDGASRGPLGAILVIWNSKKLLAIIAACSMVLAIFVDPFVQLLFTFPTRVVEDDTEQAIFQRINEVSEDAFYTNILGVLLPSQRIITSMNEGITSMNTSVAAACPSGNCLWPKSIKTLGVCGACSDVTAEAKVNCLSTTGITRPNGRFLNTTDLTCNYTYSDGSMVQAHKYIVMEGDDSIPSLDTGYSSMTAFGTVWNSTITVSPEEHGTNISLPSNMSWIQFDGRPMLPSPPELWVTSSPAEDIKVWDNLLYSYAIIQLPISNSSDQFDQRLDLPPATCWTCETYWCEKSFEAAQITNNAPPVYTVSTERLRFVYDGLHYYGQYPSAFNTQNETLWNFRYKLDSNVAPFYGLNNFFDTYYMQDYINFEVTLGVDTLDPSVVNLTKNSQGDLSNNPQALIGLVLSQDLNATFQGLLDSVTEALRTGPNAIGVMGQNLVTKSIIHVNWVWLALPLGLLVTTCVLFIIVAINSHLKKAAVWKDDPLALLFHNVDGASVLPGTNKTGSSDLDNLADEVYVRLDQDAPFKFIVSAKEAQ